MCSNNWKLYGLSFIHQPRRGMRGAWISSNIAYVTLFTFLFLSFVRYFFFEGVRQWSMCLLREFYRRSVYSCCNQLSRIKCKPYMIPFPASTSSICRSNFSSFLALMYFRCCLFVRLFDVVWSDKVYCNWNHHYLRNMLFQAWLFICTLMCGHITQEVHAHFNLSPISRGRVFIFGSPFSPLRF